MKEWQRWERMAVDFEKVGDASRAAESLSMALELLPPGHKQEKSTMLNRLERARAVMVEHGGRQARPRAGGARTGDRRGQSAGEGGREEGQRSAPDSPGEMAVAALEPERAREAVMEAAHRLCRGVAGASEQEVLQTAASDLDVEEEALQEAVEDLIDDGLLFRPASGRLMVDGIVREDDAEEVVLAAVAELSTGGRGAARAAVIERAAAGGIPRSEVEEAYTALEEAGRIEEDPHGQVRPGMARESISEVHEQVLAAVRDADDGGRAVPRASVVKDLADRGWEVDEIEEAIEELEDSGDIVLEGASMRAAVAARRTEEGAHDRVLAIVSSLAEGSGGGARPAEVVRAAGAEGLDSAMVEEALEALLDDGTLSRDRQGHLRCEVPTPSAGTSRTVVLDLVRALQRGHQGAPRTEVVEQARARGLSEDEAEETLDGLLDDGALHEHGHGFLKPG